MGLCVAERASRPVRRDLAAINGIAVRLGGAIVAGVVDGRQARAPLVRNRQTARGGQSPPAFTSDTPGRAGRPRQFSLGQRAECIGADAIRHRSVTSVCNSVTKALETGRFRRCAGYVRRDACGHNRSEVGA
jgi:hypothetical protein